MDKNWIPLGTPYDLKSVVRIPSTDAGPAFMPGKPKVVLHTFEGPSENLSVKRMAEVLNGNGGQPHFVLNIKAGTVAQMLPLSRGARTLKAGGGNYLGQTIQIEISGQAKNSHLWTPAERKHLAALLALIDNRIKMGRHCPLKFRGADSKRFTLNGWKNAQGIVGHCHAPGNDHWDPGTPNMRSIQAYMRGFA